MIESGTVGIAEYTPEGWRRLREVCGDDPDLCTFTEVQARTARMVRACKARGMPFELIAADVHYVDEMWRWCRLRALASATRSSALPLVPRGWLMMARRLWSQLNGPREAMSDLDPK